MNGRMEQDLKIEQKLEEKLRRQNEKIMEV